MAGESRASFSATVINELRDEYKERCAICLTWTQTSQCVQVLDAASSGQVQVKEAARLGVLPNDFQRNNVKNGLVQCPQCHGLFTKNCIVLSLPIPVLKYVEQYVSSKGAQKPLHKVFNLLADALEGKTVDLPNPKAILPYLGLFTIVTLNPTSAAAEQLSAAYLPELSIIHGNKFIKAPARTSATAKNVARIYNSLAICEDTPEHYMKLPLSPGIPGYEEKRYWKLPIPAMVIFAALMDRVTLDQSECDDIILVRSIVNHLGLKCPCGISARGEPCGGKRCGGGGKRSGKSGGQEGQRRSQRKNAGVKRGAPTGEGKTKAGEDDTGSVWSDPSGKALPPFPVLSWDAGVPSGSPAPSAHSLNTDAYNWSSDSGRSLSAIDPPGEDNPAHWRFHPSFSTNKNVFTATAERLV